MEELSQEKFLRIKELPIFKGIIVSDSMEPAVKIGEKIIVDVGTLNLERFDIIVFFQNGKLIAHYMWEMNKLVQPILLRTRSLKYGQLDLPIGMNQYLGKVISHRLSNWQKFRILLDLFISKKTR